MDVIELWWLSLAIFAVVVVVVAALLGLIIAAVRRVDRTASAIWTTGKQIAGNTVSIWMLEDTKGSLARTAKAARSIERSTASLEEILEGASGEGD